MKEFSAQTGGRYTYVDDIMNLQELSLAFGHIFDDCDNFIVSGCKVSGSNIGAGYVYLNGKLRYFPGATEITSWPQYIYEANKTESVAYASGADKVGRTVYGCALGATVPTALDPITQKVPVALLINQSGGTTMKDAFIGKYALLLDSMIGSQTVKGTVNFEGDVNTIGDLNAKQRINIVKGTANVQMSFNGSDFIVQSKSTSGKVYKIVVNDGIGTKFYVDESLLVTIGHTEMTISIPVNGKKAEFDGMAIQSGHFFNKSSATNSGEVNINMLSYNGGTGYFRNTYIGNGKGKAIVSVYGEEGAVKVDGIFSVMSSQLAGVVLKSTLPKTDNGMIKAIIWQDSNSDVVGQVGFTDSSTQVLRIVNNISDISISGIGSVDIGPTIKENGILLSEKYVLRSNYQNDIANLVKADSVYSKEESDNTFAKKNSGLAQFIDNQTTKEQLRSDIGALGNDDLAKCVAKDKLLSDMAITEENKKAIRNNIGAAGVGDFQAKLKDTGWIGLGNGLYIRQIGNMVSVQGTIRTIHSGTLFNIPNVVDPPTHSVYQSVSFSNSLNWMVSIKGNSRQCKVLYCNGSCYRDTDFSITYMV